MGAHSAAVDVAAVNAVVERSSVRTAVCSTAQRSAAQHGLDGGQGKALESMQATTRGAWQVGAHSAAVDAQRQAGSRGGAQRRVRNSSSACHPREGTAMMCGIGIRTDSGISRKRAVDTLRNGPRDGFKLVSSVPVISDHLIS